MLRRRCAQLRDRTHITEICAGNKRAHTGGGGGGEKHKLRSQQTQKLHACSKHIMQKGREDTSIFHHPPPVSSTFWEANDCVQWYKTSLSLLKGLGSAVGSSHSSPSVILPS